MNPDLDRDIKAAFDQIIAHTPDIGPTPSPANEVRSHGRVWLAVAAGSIVIAGTVAIGLSQSGGPEPVTSIAAVPTTPDQPEIEASVPAAAASDPTVPSTAAPESTPYEATGQRVGDTVDSDANIAGMDDETGQVDSTVMPDWIAVSRDHIVIGFVRTAEMGKVVLPADLPLEKEPLIIYDDDSQPIGQLVPDVGPVLDTD